MDNVILCLIKILQMCGLTFCIVVLLCLMITLICGVSEVIKENRIKTETIKELKRVFDKTALELDKENDK